MGLGLIYITYVEINDEIVSSMTSELHESQYASHRGGDDLL